MKVLLLGGSGLVGSHVRRSLDELGHEVFAPSSSELDLEVTCFPPKNLPPAIDGVIHVAQDRSFRNFPAGSLSTFKINTLSVAVSLDYARKAGAQHFVLASTGGVYEPTHTTITTESKLVSVESSSPYFSTKIGAEMWAMSFAKILNVHILRLFSVYGTGADPGSLFPRLEQRIRRNEAIHLNGDAGDILRPTHAIDVASAMAAALRLSGSQIINVAGPQCMPMREVADTIGEWVGTAPIFVSREADPFVLAPDIELMKACLHVPTIDLRSGLRV